MPPDVADLADLSAVEAEQDVRRDRLEAQSLLDQLAVSAARHSRRTVVLSAFRRRGLVLPPVFQEMPTASVA